MNYKEAYVLAKEYDSKLLATNPNFRMSVNIAHEDGSNFFIDSAFMLFKENWIFVFSEHHGFFVYDKDDLDGWRQYGQENTIGELI